MLHVKGEFLVRSAEKKVAGEVPKVHKYFWHFVENRIWFSEACACG
jgi:hypothetical protein